jgi:adenylate kinase
MNIFIVGNPGSGKGTQADLVAKKFGLTHFSSGAVFRQMKGDEAAVVNGYMNRGELVPDDIVIQTVEKYMTQNNLFDNLIIDGSPRSLYQYKKFKLFFEENNSKFDHAFYIKISDEEAIRRLTARREHKVTHQIYNLITNPPGPDIQENDLIQRKDDSVEAVNERLRLQKVPEDLLAELKEDGILIEINGERPVADIFADISDKLKNG